MGDGFADDVGNRGQELSQFLTLAARLGPVQVRIVTAVVASVLQLQLGGDSAAAMQLIDDVLAILQAPEV